MSHAKWELQYISYSVEFETFTTVKDNKKISLRHDSRTINALTEIRSQNYQAITDTLPKKKCEELMTSPVYIYTSNAFVHV
jgi:hypothetical protein